MSIDSVGNDAAVNAQFGSPVSDAHRLTVRGDQVGAPLVAGLICSRRPAAVIRLVISVAVNALKSQSRRAFAHVRQELLRGIQPGLANANTASTVVWKFLVRWVQTPCFHVDPGIVFPSSSEAVSQVGSRRPFFLQAPAGLNSSGAQVEGADNLGSAAVAGAIPVIRRSALSSVADGGQATYLKPGSVNKFRHFITSIMAINHCWVRSNGVIEFPLSAAKPSRA
jgi:hypothetical protein